MRGISIKKFLVFGAIVFAAALFAIWIGANLWRSYYLQEGRSAFSRGDYEIARSLFKRSLLPWFKNPESHFYLGKIALGKPNLNPGPGEVFYSQADYAAAVKHYQQSLLDGLENADAVLYTKALNDLAFSYWLRAEYGKAEEFFLKHISVAPNEAYTSRYLLALYYFDQKNHPEDALQTLKPAPSAAVLDFQVQNLFKIHQLLASLYYYFGDFDGVEQEARRAIENGGSESRSTEVQVAHTLLALAYGKRGDFVSAAQEIQKANELIGYPGVYRYNVYGCQLAKAHFLGGDYNGAISLASSVKPPETSYAYPGCMIVIGESLLALGKNREARFYLEEYLRITETGGEKDIFIVRGRERAARELTALEE